ncbi:MAG: 23S rRNA (pseudouridine(1915)-N(3))-methyltransferase RlmH [Duncaniella sp.]|nr:23S rRNA (pseudouridine(1915)-N(3))-methyltransferase RlmH [Duncaniella sp.]
MKILLIAVGKTTTAYITRAIEEYASRIGHYMKFEIAVVPDIKGSRSLSPEAQKEREGKAILALLQPGDAAVLLDERGRELTSRQLAESIDARACRGVKRLVYIIGGPYGFSPEVYAAVSERLSLSRMTFTHEMIRLFFTEQIYRAMTIIRGEPYHHD